MCSIFLCVLDKAIIGKASFIVHPSLSNLICHSLLDGDFLPVAVFLLIYNYFTNIFIFKLDIFLMTLIVPSKCEIPTILKCIIIVWEQMYTFWHETFFSRNVNLIFVFLVLGIAILLQLYVNAGTHIMLLTLVHVRA